MTVVIVAEAEHEFLKDADYYEQQQPGLGIRFRNEVASVVDWLTQNTDVPRLRPGGYRRVNLRSFPHYVAYIVRNDTIWIAAISHAHRRPDHWFGRV